MLAVNESQQCLEEKSINCSDLTSLPSRAFCLTDKLLWGSVLTAWDPMFLNTFGITDVVSLVGEETESAAVPEDLSYQLEKSGIRVSRHRVALGRDPAPESILEARALIRTLLGDPDKRVFVHCIKGEERTPLVLSQLNLVSDKHETGKIISQARERSLNELKVPYHPVKEINKVIMFNDATLGNVISKILSSSGCNIPLECIQDTTSLAHVDNALVIIPLIGKALQAGIAQRVRLAEAVSETGIPVLLVSPMSFGKDVEGFRSYWDISSPKSITESVLDLVKERPTHAELKGITPYFLSFFKIDRNRADLGHEY